MCVCVCVCVCVCRLDYNKLHIEETSRNLNKRICELKSDFKTGNTTNSLVSYDITTNHTFDFHNSNIFTFIHDRDKRRIYQILTQYYNDQVFQNIAFSRFFKNIAFSSKKKKMLKNFKIHL